MEFIQYFKNIVFSINTFCFPYFATDTLIFVYKLGYFLSVAWILCFLVIFMIFFHGSQGRFMSPLFLPPTTRLFLTLRPSSQLGTLI